jgi:hypothetical protein
VLLQQNPQKCCQKIMIIYMALLHKKSQQYIQKSNIFLVASAFFHYGFLYGKKSSNTASNITSAIAQG